MSWGSDAWKGVSQGAHNLGSMGADLGRGAGGFASQNMGGPQLAQFDQFRRRQTMNGLGRGVYNAFDPEWSIQNPGTVGNPWAAARLGAAAPMAAAAPFAMSPGFLPGAAGVGAANMGMYNAYAKHDRRLKQRGQFQANQAYNRDMSQSGAQGIAGNLGHAAAGQDVAQVLAANEARRAQAAQAYQNAMLSQLQFFMSMGGDVAGSVPGHGSNPLLPFLGGQGGYGGY